MPILLLARKSLHNRRLTALLTLLSIALSVALLLGVERLRSEARHSFSSTISGTDLIVGARSGAVQLLLYTVFHLGDATNNLSWQSYRQLAADPRVAWTIPLALGDSHRGYRVIGTSAALFDHYRYADARPLAFAHGGAFTDLYHAVLGADVAAALSYGLGDAIVVTHGSAPDSAGLAEHGDQPFRVAGILQRTGTPLDRAVLVSLEAIEAIHLGWSSGMPGRAVSAQQARAHDLAPTSITAFFVGLHHPTQVFQIQRAVNDFRGEPLLAVLPGVALDQLWTLVGAAERMLLAIAGLVVVMGLLGLLTTLLTGLNERRREMAVLRAVGARPGHIFALVAGESLLLTVVGAALGVVLVYALLLVGRPWLEGELGLFIRVGWPGGRELLLLAAVLAAGALAGLLPALRAYRQSLADGLSVRL